MITPDQSIRLFCLLIIPAVFFNAVAAADGIFDLDEFNTDETVFEIAASGDNIWVGYPDRLYFSDNSGISWIFYDSTTGFGRGSLTSLTLTDNSIWTATYYDTVLNGFDYYVGGGIYTANLPLVDWQHLDIPGRFDAGNIVYDIVVVGDTIWTANWWGGLKRSTDRGLDWESIVPDSGQFNPHDNEHHRIFSVTVNDGIIWAGSQFGINLSENGGLTWRNIHHDASESTPISDKIVALGDRPANGGEMWAACHAAVGSGGVNGVSISADTERTWRTVLEGERAWNFLFNDDDIFVAGNSGLWFSGNDGMDFENLTALKIASGTVIYKAAITSDSAVWIGTSDGLYRGDYAGTVWEKVDFVALNTDSDGPARPVILELGRNFPNPFNPETTIPVYLDKAQRISLRIYDILGRRQKTIIDGFIPAGEHSFVWGGSNDRGRDLPSGLYFYQLDTTRGKSVRKMILLR